MKKLSKAAGVILGAALLLQTDIVFAATESLPINENFALGLCNTLEMPEDLEVVGATRGYQAGDTVVSILGDSISTYMGYTDYNAAGNYYNESIMPVDSTWWMSLLKEEGWSLGVNESLGGSNVSWNGEENSQYHTGQDFYMASETRINKLGKNGTPDKIFIYGGTNDILSQGKVQIESDSSSPVYGTVDTFEDAYYTMIRRIEKKYPNSEIICLIPYETVWALDYDTVAEAQKKAPAIIKKICKKEGISYVDLRDAGIDAEKDLIEDDLIHPNELGMAKIKAHVQKSMAPRRGLWKEDGKVYFYDENSKLVTNKTISVDGDTYFFQADGSAVTNMLMYDSDGTHKVYYGEDGRRVKNTMVQDEKSGNIWYFDKDGYQIFNDYAIVDGKAYFFDASGNRYTKRSYEDDQGNIRFFHDDGTMIYNDYYCDGVYTYYAQYDGTAMKNRLTYDPEGTGLIYFNEKGHMLFDAFQYCEDVKYTCYFATDGRAYFDQTTFVGDKAYYLNACGKMEDSGWFTYANGVDHGFANADGTLKTGGFSLDPWGRTVYYHWNGMVARGLIQNWDGTYYHMDETDGHLLGTFR